MKAFSFWTAMVCVGSITFFSSCQWLCSPDKITSEMSDCEVAAVKSARSLVKRILPEHAGQLRIELISAENGKDVFELDAADEKVILRGNNPIAIASALNHYLKYTAKCNISWNCGDQMNLPEVLPAPQKVRVVSPHQFRPAYNYCTHGYTMPWWDFEQWEKELDYLAMSGLNMALIIQGQEQVWINTLTKVGYTEEEVLKWLVMPTHQPWMFMGNMESFGGPMPKSLPAKRVELVRKIVARMNELGMKPILQGYYGIVPFGFSKKYPESKVHPQGKWANQMQRPDMLEPTDPMFTKIADIFYKEQLDLYGNLEFLAADPFHEGGSIAGIDLPKCGESILGAMQRAQPGATWVIQAWGANPRAKMLEKLNKSNVLILDLFCEAKTVWKNRKGYDGVPWVWCTISNFGGNTGMDGTLVGMAQQPAKTLTDPDRASYSGVGAVPEGSQTNPVIWDLHFENIWRTQPVADCQAWLHQYAERRYGKKSVPAEKAWDYLLKTSYGRVWGEGNGGETPFNSVMNGRPSLNPLQRARVYAGNPVPPYEDRAEFLFAAWESLIAAGEECGNSDGYRYDLTDLTRQMICDAATRVHGEYVKAYKAKDKVKVAELSKIMLSFYDDLDELLGTRPEFLLGTWIKNARRWGTTTQESDLYEHNSRMLLTTWTEPTFDLTDYANRSWNGLVKDFYKQRWVMFYDKMNTALNANQDVDVNKLREDIKQWEYTWNKQTVRQYLTTPEGDTLSIVDRIYKKFLTLDPAISRKAK